MGLNLSHEFYVVEACWHNSCEVLKLRVRLYDEFWLFFPRRVCIRPLYVIFVPRLINDPRRRLRVKLRWCIARWNKLPVPNSGTFTLSYHTSREAYGIISTMYHICDFNIQFNGWRGKNRHVRRCGDRR